MSRASLHPAVAEVVEGRRLGSLEASRQHFTVSREAALLRLREQALEHEQARGGERWLWTLALVRAANALSELAELEIDVEALEAKDGDSEELEVTSFDVLTPGVELDELDLADMLAGALAPDLGEPISGGDAALRQRRFRMLIGRAINHALAHDPVAVELSTPAGGRRFERREQVGEGRDPYAERRVAGLDGHSRFVLRVVAPRPSLGARLGRWVRGRSQTERVLRELWTKHRLRERDQEYEDEGPAIPLGPVLGGEPVELGKHALFGPRARLADPPSSATLSPGIWLVRDGVLLLDLLPTLGPAGILKPELNGWIDCPSLRLTADERAVVKDGAFEVLVAWLADYLERREDDGTVRWPTSPFVDPERSDDPKAPGLRSASGRSIVREQLADGICRGRELVYVWRHQAREVAAYEQRDKILAPSPAELDLLRAEFPDARLVPLRALGGETKIDPENLSSLRGASYEPLVLAKHSPVELPARAGRSPGVPPVVRISVEAYVHRSSAATLGFIAILAYERRVAQISDRARVFSGVTLLCRVSSGGEDDALAADALDFGALRRDHLAVSAIADACRKHALAHWEALLTHVMSRAKPWENPLLRGVLDQLGARQIELAYREIEGARDGSEPELRLAWRDTAALEATVGERVEDGEPRSLRDALRQLREPGYVVLAHPSRSYASLRSADPRLRPWRVHSWARPALERVAGRYCLLEMPAVPEAYPLVRARDQLLDDQRHLLRDAGEVRKDRERASVDPLARLRLLGQLLVARGLGRDTLGLEDRPLLERYDPRALTPTRLVSLAAALAERPRPGLVPVGAVHRGLPAPVIEATPGLAALLHAEGFVPATLEHAGAGAAVVPDRPELADEGPVRRRARELPPLLARTVVHPLVVGRLFVAGDGESEGVDLWLEGLRVGEIELDEPLGRVSGRLVLTSRAARIDRQLVKREVADQARALIADALRQRALLPPLGEQRERLDHFIDYARAVVRQRDPFELAEPLGVAEPEDRGRRVATLQQMSLAAAPLRPLPDRRDALLAQVVRQSLAMAVHFDTSLLSWRAAKLGKRRRDGSLEISFGLRNGWIQRGLDEDRELDLPSHKRAALLAGVLVIAEFFDQAREREELGLGPEHLTVALWRLMKMS